jgi:hypothetical protein
MDRPPFCLWDYGTIILPTDINILKKNSTLNNFTVDFLLETKLNTFRITLIATFYTMAATPNHIMSSMFVAIPYSPTSFTTPQTFAINITKGLGLVEMPPSNCPRWAFVTSILNPL